MYKPVVSKTEVELFHGTTLSRAQQIEADQGFRRSRGGVFVVFKGNRDIAEFFARRTARNEGGTPAVVKALITTEDFDSLRKNGDVTLIRFDEHDDEFLRSRNQWVISPRGVEVLNPRWIDISTEILPKA